MTRQFSIGLFLCLLLGSGTVLAEAGRFQFVQGEVTVIRPDGGQSAAHKGDGVEEGDTIVSGPAAQAQLVMKDEGLIALRPDSRLRIEVYRFAGKTDGTEQGVLELLKGGFRAITGLIGRVHKDSYQVRTPTATIGIRGTDHEPVYIPPPAPGETPLGPPGTYDKVNVGRTYVETGAGRVEVGANQVGFAPALGSAPPVRLPGIPNFMGATPPIQEAAKGSGQGSSGSAATPATTTATSGTANSDTSSTSGTIATTSMVVSTVVAAPVATVIPPSPTGTFNLQNPPSGGAMIAPNGTAVAGGGMGVAGPSNGAGFIGDPASSLIVTLDSSGGPVSVSGNNFSYNRNGASQVMGGSAAVGGETVRWGIYAGGTMVDSGITSTGTPFFWMDSTSASTAASLLAALPNVDATLRFTTTAGFTSPITESGAIGGTVTSTVELRNIGGAPSVSTYTLNVTDAQNRIWGASLTASQSLDSFRSGGVQNLYGACSGCAQTIVTGNVQGVVVGNPTPVGIISSYKMTAGTSAVAGSVFNR